MEKVTFSIPALWADHHTLAVRETLAQVNGIEDVNASSLYKDVVIKYDPAKVTPETLTGTLAEAGYSVGQAPELSNFPKGIDDASAWFQVQERKTETDMRDLAMSGDHRKY